MASITVTGNKIVNIQDDDVTVNVTSSTSTEVISDATAASYFLARTVYFTLSNGKKVITFGGIGKRQMKLTFSGNKYIGIQQDTFTLSIHNLALRSQLYALISNHYIYIKFYCEPYSFAIFSGEIRVVNTGMDSAIDRTIELICLQKASDFLANMLVPVTWSSSMNLWAVLEDLSSKRNTETHETVGSYLSLQCTPKVKASLQSTALGKDYATTKATLSIIEDIVTIFNEKQTASNKLEFGLVASNNSSFVKLFNVGSESICYLVSPKSGLLDSPSVQDTGIQFNHVFRQELVPGNIVKIDNKYIGTVGGSTAFIYAYDQNGEYVITEVAYQFATYPNKYTCTVKARPRSKYQNFAAAKTWG